MGASVQSISFEWGESCITGSMGLKGWHGDILYVISSLRAGGLFNPGGMGLLYPNECCCGWGGACLCDVYGLYTYYPHIFDGGPGGRMYASPGILDDQYEPFMAGGCITASAGDDPFGHALDFRWVGEPGFQYVRTLVFSHHGEELVDIVYPMFGSKGTTVANRATAPLYALAESIPQPTLTVDIEVEGNVVPPAVAGHYTFPQGEDYEGGKKYYTYEMDYPDPYFDKHTELIAVTAVPHNRFEFKAWTGNCAYFDDVGNYLGMLPESITEDPDDWITDDTIYVKCLKAVGTHTASAMTDMAVLAGASVEGALPETVLVAINAMVQAQVVPVTGQVDSVEFVSDHGVMRSALDPSTGSEEYDYLGPILQSPEWDRLTGRNNPITHTRNTKMQVRVTFTLSGPLGFAQLVGKGGTGYWVFEHVSTASPYPGYPATQGAWHYYTAGSTTTYAIAAELPLPNKICRRIDDIEWEIRFKNATRPPIPLGTTGPHDVFVTFGTPNTSQGFFAAIPTPKRCDFVWTGIGESDPYDASNIAKKVAENIVANSDFGWPPAPGDEWEGLGATLDCERGVGLLLRCLDIIGWPIAWYSTAVAYPSTDVVTSGETPYFNEVPSKCDSQEMQGTAKLYFILHHNADLGVGGNWNPAENGMRIGVPESKDPAENPTEWAYFTVYFLGGPYTSTIDDATWNNRHCLYQMMLNAYTEKPYYRQYWRQNPPLLAPAFPGAPYQDDPHNPPSP